MRRNLVVLGRTSTSLGRRILQILSSMLSSRSGLSSCLWNQQLEAGAAAAALNPRRSVTCNINITLNFPLVLLDLICILLLLLSSTDLFLQLLLVGIEILILFLLVCVSSF
jgi:hypothetical protein